MDTSDSDQNSSNSNENQNASGESKKGDSGEEKESLDSLFATLKQQINTSDWLEKNTAEKWEKENPEYARQYREAAMKKT